MISAWRLWSKTLAAGLGTVLLLLSTQVSHAVSIQVSVNVVGGGGGGGGGGGVIPPPSCKINGTQPIEVNFGEVVTTKLDSNNYIKDVLYDIKCTNATSNDMFIRIEGAYASVGNSILNTNNKDLGIILTGNGHLALNTAIRFKYPDVPKLQVALLKYEGKKLKPGPFSAVATMIVSYY